MEFTESLFWFIRSTRVWDSFSMMRILRACTPLHYACRLGIPESVKNMLGYRGLAGPEVQTEEICTSFCGRVVCYCEYSWTAMRKQLRASAFASLLNKLKESSNYIYLCVLFSVSGEIWEDQHVPQASGDGDRHQTAEWGGWERTDPTAPGLSWRSR